MRRRAAPCLAAIAAAMTIVLAAGCGGGDPPAEQGIGVNPDLQLADCDNWNEASVDERLLTVEQLREFAGGPVGNIPARGAILDDEDAYDLFERYCESEFAGAFKLYKLYTRFAAFTGH